MMASTPEGKVKIKAKKILDKLGAYYFMPMGGPFGRSGIPDIIGCLNGRFFGIECKANGNKPTALQMRELQDILDHGGISMIIDENNVDYEIERKLK